MEKAVKLKQNIEENSGGFTLIEMLVVIAVIGILAGVIIAGLGPSRVKARNARRATDVHSIQTQLEVAYNSTEGYPASLADANIEPLQDPQDNPYQYETTNGGFDYTVGICLEDPNPDDGVTSEVDNSDSVTCPSSVSGCEGGSFCASSSQ